MSENKPQEFLDPVLSSVRKIVTRTASEAADEMEDETTPAHPEDVPVEKLLLTPALRIDPEPEPSEEPRRTRRTRVQTRTLAAERISLEQRIAELERAVGEGGDWEPDGSEPGDPETPRSFVFHEIGLEDEAVDEVGEELEKGGDDDHPPESPSDDAPAFRTDRNLVRIVPEPEELAESQAPRTGIEPVGDVEPAGAPDEPVIEEEALREIVSEIVRSELQGELGERITRNVRKLVRREIQRALMTRDFT